jgi:hypothetical protein
LTSFSVFQPESATFAAAIHIDAVVVVVEMWGKQMDMERMDMYVGDGQEQRVAILNFSIRFRNVFQRH